MDVISPLPVRLIARLDVKGPNVVKGIQLEGLRIVGEPATMARKYYRDGIDEVLFVDTVASLYQRSSILDVVRATAADVFVPITVGGGIRTLDDVVAALRSGADKVSVNTAAIARPRFLEEVARTFGSQCIVLSVEAKRRRSGRGWEALTDNGRERTDVDVLDWVAEGERLGAGEILVTSVDQEGSARGMDLELLSAVHDRVKIPVIGSGGVGSANDVAQVFLRGAAEAVACAHVLHYELTDVAGIKDHLARNDILVRPNPRVERSRSPPTSTD